MVIFGLLLKLHMKSTPILNIVNLFLDRHHSENFGFVRKFVENYCLTSVKISFGSSVIFVRSGSNLVSVKMTFLKFRNISFYFMWIARYCKYDFHSAPSWKKFLRPGLVLYSSSYLQNKNRLVRFHYRIPRYSKVVKNIIRPYLRNSSCDHVENFGI